MTFGPIRLPQSDTGGQNSNRGKSKSPAGEGMPAGVPSMRSANVGDAGQGGPRAQKSVHAGRIGRQRHPSRGEPGPSRLGHHKERAGDQDEVVRPGLGQGGV